MDVPSGKRFALPTEAQEYAASGGCYNSEPYTCTSSYHGRVSEHNGRNATVGFRIVLRRTN